MEKGKILFLKSAIILLGVIMFALCIGLAELARYTAKTNPEYAYLRYPILFGMYVTVIPFYIALFQAYKLLKYIEIKNASSQLALQSLQIIKRCAVTISILYVVGSTGLLLLNVLHPGIFLTGIAIIFTSLVIAVFAAVLQALFKSALEIKEENELTI
jgi:Protein of unknown function (DUF2975)